MSGRAKVEIVLDCEDPARLAAFWRQALGYREYYTDEAVAVLLPEDESGAPFLLQAVPEPKAGKNRMHVDVLAADLEAETARLGALGACRIDEVPQHMGGTDWIRMEDPEGNEFCVSTGVPW